MGHHAQRVQRSSEYGRSRQSTDTDKTIESQIIFELSRNRPHYSASITQAEADRAEGLEGSTNK